jgi:hypothetical protein
MTNPHHHTMSDLTDPHPVRPGTSAALTARTIDATIHPPIVRAQEAVAAFIPRVTAPLSSANAPLLAAMVGGTLILVWVAHRVHFRPAGLLMSAMLMMMLTSIHPVPATVEATRADDALVGSSDAWTPRDRYQMPMPTPQAAEPVDVSQYPYIDQTPAPSDAIEDPRDFVQPADPQYFSEPDRRGRVRNYRLVIPAQPQTNMMPMEELMRLEQEQMREQLRASLDVLERRLRAEARRRERELRRRWAD